MDPDPGSHIHSDPDLALNPNGIRINTDPDPTYIVQIFLKLKANRSEYAFFWN